MDRKEIRKKIDRIDERLLSLFNKRGELAAKVGRLKNKRRRAVYDPVREEKILRRIAKKNRGPLPAHSLRAVYRELISACRGLQRSIAVSYLGPSATFTHQAARKQFGESSRYLPEKSIAAIFQEVETGGADFGVVPIENSLEGSVNNTLDMFLETPLKICSEIYLRVSHNLLSNCRIDEIERIYSHPQVFGQCRRYLREHLPHADLVEVASTARAAELAAGEKGSAALGGTLAAAVYKLKILSRNIEDAAGNITRFLVVGKNIPAGSEKDRTSILFSLAHRAGSLYDALAVFQRRGINLTRIESRPFKTRAWEYYFFVDFEGHCRQKRIKAALADLDEICRSLKILGSYPRAEL